MWKEENRYRKDKGNVKVIKPVGKPERQTGLDWALNKGEENILKEERKIITLEKWSLEEKNVWSHSTLVGRTISFIQEIY